MKTTRFPALFGWLTALGLWLCGSALAQTEPAEPGKKRGFPPVKFIGKLIPGGSNPGSPPQSAPVDGAFGRQLPGGSGEPLPAAAEEAGKKERPGLIGRLRQRRESETPPAPVAVPIQPGPVADATLSDRPRPQKPAHAKTSPAAPPAPRPAPAPEERPPAWESPAQPLRPDARSAEQTAGKAAAASDPEPEEPASPALPREAENSGAHYVAIRDGVEAAVAFGDGTAAKLPPGTVLRFLGRDGDRVRVRLAGGAEALLESWQVRDATFDEAVAFLQAEG